MFVGSQLVITLEEVEQEILETIRKCLREDSSIIRRMGADYLAYSICDALVDGPFLLLDRLGERLDDLEDILLVRPDREAVSELHDLKPDLFLLHRLKCRGI